MAKIPSWQIAGDWFDVCSCRVPCPCTHAQPATDGVCEAVLVWRISKGHYGDVALQGLHVVGVSRFEGDLWAGQARNFKFGLFIDERADERQRKAIQAIWSGEAGGSLKKVLDIWGPIDVVGLEFAPIQWTLAQDLSSWSVNVPGKVEGRAEALTGPTTPPGKRVQTFNPPGSETGGSPATWAVATKHRVQAFGFNWEWHRRSAKHIPFDWTGP